MQSRCRMTSQDTKMWGFWQLFHGEKPSVATLKTSGAPCYVSIPGARRKKLDSKSVPRRVLGFALPNMQAYRVLLTDGKVMIS
jgi:hypothetical protein